MKKNRHGMIRFRIFGIFHKHFVWRLLNYNPERKKKKKQKTIKSGLFTSTFLYNTHTHIYMLYIKLHRVCVNKIQSLQLKYHLNRRIFACILYMHKIGVFTWGYYEMVGSEGISYFLRWPWGGAFRGMGFWDIYALCVAYLAQEQKINLDGWVKNVGKYSGYDNQVKQP